MKKYCFLSALLFLNISDNSFAADDPKLPKDPSADFTFNELNVKELSAEVYRAGENTINGKIILRITEFSILYQGGKISIKTEDIRSIEFIEWRERAADNNVFMFFPGNNYAQ